MTLLEFLDYPDYREWNVFRDNDIIFYRTECSTYHYYVKTHSWDNIVPQNEICKLTFKQPKQFVFKGTYLGDYLNMVHVDELYNTDFIFLQDHPLIEQAVKLNFPFILNAIRKGIDFNYNIIRQSSLSKATNMSVNQMRMFQSVIMSSKNNDLLYYLNRLGIIVDSYKGLNDETFENLLKIALNDNISNSDLDLYKQLILDKSDSLNKKLIKILEYTDNNYIEYYNLRTTLKDLNQLDENLFPLLPKANVIKDLIPELSTRIQVYENQQLYDSLNKSYEKIVDLLLPLEFNNDDYIITVPKKVEELDTEGNTLHHCVGSYKQNIANGKEIILFLRKKTNPITPYYTIDIDNEGFIRQIHTAYNKNISTDPDKEKIKEFLNSWADANSFINKKTLKLTYAAKAAI